jgi:hypothetical protein
MTKKKTSKRYNKKINKKVMRKTKSRKTKLFRGGKCPCSGGDSLKSSPPIMVGGYGPASFQPLPLNTFYEKVDPTIMSLPINDRNTPMHPSTPILMGGKKSRKNKKIKIMHGGNLIPEFSLKDPILGNTNNVVLYTNTTPGTFTGHNLMNGVGYSYSNITDGPLLYPDRNSII